LKKDEMKKREEEKESKSRQAEGKPKEVVFVRTREDGTTYTERTGHTQEELQEMANYVTLAEGIIDEVKRKLAGISEQIHTVRKAVFWASQNDKSVLILGETGTGKEIVARQIHANSKRAKNPFVVLQPAGLPENLVDAELFGSSKHAYTDAIDRPGLINAANRGTLFIDEIADLPPSTQSKLLRAIQFKTCRRLGEVRERKSDFRLICATNRALLDSGPVTPGSASKEPKITFRSDLYYRIAETVVEISALRERREDILPIFLYLVRRHFPKIDLGKLTMSWISLYCLLMNDWRGNVRELENVVKRQPIRQWKLEKETVYVPFDPLEVITVLAVFKNDQYDISGPGYGFGSRWGAEQINVVRFAKRLETLVSEHKPGYWKKVEGRPLKSIFDLTSFDVERVLVDEGRKLEALPKYREHREKYKEKRKLEAEKKEREGLLASLGMGLVPNSPGLPDPVKSLLGLAGLSKSEHRSEGVREGGDLFSLSYRKAKAEFEKAFLGRALILNDWNQAKTAKAIGMSPQQLSRQLAKLGMRRPKKRPKSTSS
jgi:DNA-binding NtrC family response regulator